MRLDHALPAALLLALALPSTGQLERRPFFSVSTQRTYAPGEKPSVQLWAQSVDSLEFRVYRVKDPEEFFRKLEDLHSLGGRAPGVPAKLTPIERFHQFKRRIWVKARNLVRFQFRAETRARIRDWMSRQGREPSVRGAAYARVPLLNPQQLVSMWRQSIPRGRPWESMTVPVDVPGKGLYVVEAVDGELRAYTLVFVTDLAVLSKTAPGRVLIYVVDRTTGAPAADCPVLVWAGKNEVARLKTDAQGLTETQVKEERVENALAIARRGDDFAVSSLAAWTLGGSPEGQWTGYLYTDRPVYRPGHTVQWKGILRTMPGSEYRLPDRREVTVEINDPEDRPVARKTLPVSAMGTVHDEVALGPSAALGYYSIEVSAGEARMHGGFHVEEYKKPEYEVRVTPEKRMVLQGETVRAAIEARYYFGEPVANAKVTFVAHRSAYWSPFFPREEEDSEEPEDEGGYFYGQQQVLEQTGRLDAEGRLTVEIPTEILPGDQRYRIEARVTDEANREISGAGFVVATYGSFAINVQPDRYLCEPGGNVRFRVEARDYEGRPVETPVRFELAPWRWQAPEAAPVFTAERRTDPAGAAAFDVTMRDGGSFVGRVRARTPEGREVVGTTHVWVPSGSVPWYGARRERVQIVPDKKAYSPGETARVLIVTGVPDSHVLVTVEGKELYTRQVVEARSPAVTVEIPVLAAYEPNFFLSAVFVRGNQFYSGAKSIRVPPVERRLDVEVKASKTEYKPGEPAVFTVDARDHQGKPVAAEFSLGIVDEAIYAIRPEQAQDIVRFFYGRSYNRVFTGSSLSYFFHGMAGKRLMQLAGLRPSALAQLKPERLVEPRVRKAFPDTALWLADLRTGADGHAEARLSFPDSLTTWRATARGVTADTRVGSAVQKTVVRKNLLVRLAAPRFFTDGDEVTVSAIVHNYLPAGKTARVSLEAQGLEILEGAARDVEIPSRGDAKVDWRVRARAGQEVMLTGKALTDEESDAMEIVLPVIPFGVKLAESRAGSLGGAQETADVQMAFPPLSAPSSRALEIGVSPSIGGAVFGALDFLTSFPYGCTEQTMSSFLPNVIVARASQALGAGANVDAAGLRRKVRAGLERLYELQHSDGGWGWWETDETHAFMTAYVLAGLAQARDAGYPVRPHAIAQAAAWLRSQGVSPQRAGADLRAYIAYALALAGARETALLDPAWSLRGEMTPYGLALLGLALDAAGDKRAEEVVSRLESLAVTEGPESHWQVDRDTLMEFHGDASPEATAHALKLLVRRRPESPLLERAALWLVNHRDQGFYWQSTKQTAMVVYGLTDYLQRSGELKPDFTVTVAVNGRQVLTRRFTAQEALGPAPPVIRLGAGQTAPSNSIRITKSGPGRLYWSVRADYYSTEEKLVRTGTVSLNVLRNYYRLTPASEGGRVVHEVQPLDGPVKAGDVLLVRLTVSGGNWSYLQLEDPIPAGTEFVRRDDLYQIKDRPPWWRYWFTRREFRDDRAALFQTHFDTGQMQYVYLLKVVNPGRFRVSPARVQPMYQPRYLATTESMVLEAR